MTKDREEPILTKEDAQRYVAGFGYGPSEINWDSRAKHWACTLKGPIPHGVEDGTSLSKNEQIARGIHKWTS